MIIQPRSQTSHAARDFVALALDRIERARKKLPPNKFLMNSNNGKKKSVFEPLGDGLYRKGGSIFLRIQRGGMNTWLTTGTNELPRARKFKEKWEHEQWIQKNGFSPRPTSAENNGQGRKEPQAENGNGSGKGQAPEDPPMDVNDYLDQYHAAVHPIIKKRGLKRKAERTIANENYGFGPVRAYFGAMDPERLTGADFDNFHAWRQSGGYVAHFVLRGKMVKRMTRGGDRAVDLNLVLLRNALELGVRRGQLTSNPLDGRGQYTDDAGVRHCREVAPTPESLVLIVDWMRENSYQQDADLTEFLAYSGLRIGEGLGTRWLAVDWEQEVIHVRRSKKGVFPFVLLLPELKRLLRRMKQRAKSKLKGAGPDGGKLLFPSVSNPERPREPSAEGGAFWFLGRGRLDRSLPSPAGAGEPGVPVRSD